VKCAAVLLLFIGLAGCGGNGADLSEDDIGNRASAISQSANETVAGQIAEIEQKTAEDRANDAPSPAANAVDAETKTQN
jgi:hypothetical protein